jgi:hypothetical protein
MNKDFNISQSLKILDIKRQQYFYWTIIKELIKPDFRGEGRGGRTRLSLMNLVELSIIKALVGLGVELNVVRRILQVRFNSTDKRKSLKSMRLLEWACREYRRKNRDYPKCYLLLYKEIIKEKNQWIFYPLYYLRSIDLGSILERANPAIILEFFSILKNIEDRTGEKV